MPAEPGAALAESARRRHQNTIDKARRALRAAEASGEPVTYANIAAGAGVSRSWLYTQPEIRAAIERLRDDNGRSAAAPVPTRQRASAAPSFAGSKPRTAATENSAAKSPSCATSWPPLTANSGKPGADQSRHLC